ncbi:MAG: non-proteolytic protein peptidase family [Gammaproteobacteria bacterium]|jgi:serine protease SohB|nr:non-proteolytic protein peptidase family [Gammaproteobacteria bacterium]
MLHFVAHYLLFLLEAFTIVLAILFCFGGILALSSKAKERQKKGKLNILPLHKRFLEQKLKIAHEVLDKKACKQLAQVFKQSKKQKKVQESKKLFVLNFKGDIQASQVDSLREEITAILAIAAKHDEVLLRLESPGGMIHGYGLAASQLDRIKQHKLHLTIAVDKVAASGGYMMACIADKIISAPFAIIGSIGAVMQLPNFHRWLGERGIDFEQLTAGEYKRTLTLFGENTEKGRQKAQTELEEAHGLFKQFISMHRPQVNIQEVATGEHWFGIQALDKKLVDDLVTSDEYLLNLLKQSVEVYEVSYSHKKPVWGRLAQSAKNAYIVLSGRSL